MSFDSSRFTFNPRRNFLGVVMEQGRVQLDSDWNESQSEFARRIQAGTLDLLGPSGYPVNVTPHAFQISTSGGAASGYQITIGTGRYYIDGLLAENHGVISAEGWDPAMGEMSGAPYTQPLPNNSISYTQQPYYPNPPAIGAGPYLVYLDVWQREVTYLEDPWLVDPAVNVDTTGRMQTVWQVKLLDLSKMSGSIDCSSDIPSFDTLVQPSAARLSNHLQTNTPAGPCCLSPNTGYTGLENQLYRVEIHKGGSSPTFKWSRDNASVATSVNALATVQVSGSNVTRLTLATLGRDSVLGFANGNWIEIVDDSLELNNQPGELAQIASTGPGNTVTLNSQLAGSYNPSDASRHTRIIRWDQSNTTTGDIPIPTDGSAVALENGITVTFGPDPPAGPYYSGDFWNFAARASDATIQPLSSAPPRGIHHHYAKLAIVTFSGNPTDCRVPWPPNATGSCCCSVTVTPSNFAAGATLQSILDQYKNLGTATEICLAPGTYSLPAPLRFTAAHTNITLKACQSGTAVLQAQSGQAAQFSDGLIVLDNVDNVTLRGLQLEVPVAAFPANENFAGLSPSVLSNLDPTVAAGLQSLFAAIGVRTVGSTNVTISECLFDLTGLATATTDNSFPFGAAIFASGECDRLRVEKNQFTGTTQLGDLSFQAGYLHVPAVTFEAPSTPAGPPWTHYYPVGAVNVGKIGTRLDAFQNAAQAAQAIKTARAETLLSRLATPSAPSGTRAAVNPVTGVVIKGPSPTRGPSPSPTNLAANGGSVLGAILGDTVFRNNTFNALNAAALIVGETETVSFLANQVTNCAAGFLILSPLQMASLFDLALENIGILVALGYPLPQGDTSSLTSIAAAPASLLIYAGSNSYTDSSGNVWVPDTTKSAGFTITGGPILNRPSPAPAINEENGGGADPDETLYQSERYASKGTSFTYTFNNLPPGFYQVTLKFAELTWTGSGERVFNVAINGTTVLNQFDIVADSRGEFIADDQVFANIQPLSTGKIAVEFTSVTDNASICGIGVVPQWNLPSLPSLSSQGNVEVLNFFFQIAQLAEQAYAVLTWTPAQLRIQDNEMQGLIAPSLMVLGDDTTMNGRASSLMLTGNRLSSSIQSEFAATLIALALSSGTTDIPPADAALVATLALFATVSIVQITQCLVSANMVLNPAEQDVSFLLVDSLIAKPQLLVMSNLFYGLMAIFPKNYPALEAPIAPVGCRAVLNTVVANESLKR